MIASPAASTSGMMSGVEAELLVAITLKLLALASWRVGRPTLPAAPRMRTFLGGLADVGVVTGSLPRVKRA